MNNRVRTGVHRTGANYIDPTAPMTQYQRERMAAPFVQTDDGAGIGWWLVFAVIAGVSLYALARVFGQ